MKSLRSLIITTLSGKSSDAGNGTGVWMEDLAAPYFILKDGGEYITIASPEGGRIPVDPNSLTARTDRKNTVRFQQDPQAMYRITHSLPLNKIRKEDFDLVFIAGGYRAMWDFPENNRLQQLVGFFVRQQIPIGFIGHALATMILLTKYDGRPLVAGRKLTAYSNQEEEGSPPSGKPPFLLESKLIELGAIYSKGPAAASYVMTDRNIVTGQNPASAVGAAEKLLLLAQNKERDTQLLMEEKIY